MLKNFIVLLATSIILIQYSKSHKESATPDTNNRIMQVGALTESQKIQALEFWKIILESRINFIRSTEGYASLLENYGISFLKIKDFLNEPAKWTVLIADFENYSDKMDDLELKNVSTSLKFLPTIHDINYLISTKKSAHTEFIEMWISMVQESNKKNTATEKAWDIARNNLVIKVKEMLTKYGGEVYTIFANADVRSLR
jgi:hypothetical protein